MRVVKMRVMHSIIPLSFVAMIASICHVKSVCVSVKMRHDPALFALIRDYDCPRHLTTRVPGRRGMHVKSHVQRGGVGRAPHILGV